MKPSALAGICSVIIGLVLMGGMCNHVAAEMRDADESVYISGGGGIFFPFQGKSGFNAVVQAAGKISPRERMGMELEYRQYETELFNAKDIDTQSYIFRIFGHYLFPLGGITPYVGLGLNMAVNVFDKKEIEKKRSSVNIKRRWGFGYGLMGLAGVEVPVGRVAFFAEGRVSGDYQLTDYKKSGKRKLGIESFSGLTGMGGLRVRF